jgi:branched-chain amino acid transport system ATP-binding protein
MLEINNLSKSFGGLKAVNEISLRIDKNEIRALIGPNGAGKTTLFNLISGKLFPTGGKILYEGKDITGLKPYEIYGMGIHRTFQTLSLYPKLTVFQSIQLALLSAKEKKYNFVTRANNLFHDEVFEILRKVQLDHKANILSSSLSHGERRRLDLGIAITGKPRLLLLDEAASGMAPNEAAETMTLIIGLARDHGLTVFFIEHDMSFVFGMAEKVSVMHYGSLIAEGSVGEIKNNKKVQQVYLGEGDLFE